MLALSDAAIRISTLKHLSPRRHGERQTGGCFSGISGFCLNHGVARTRKYSIGVFSVPPCLRGEVKGGLLDIVHRQLRPEILTVWGHRTRYDRRKRLLVLGILLRQGLNKSHILLERLHLVSDVGRRILIDEI